jgi:hypothetical protein
MLTSEDIAALTRLELTKITNPDLVHRIHELQVSPYVVQRDWDYGKPGEAFDCWIVLEHWPSNTGIAYCEKGFGPAYPWGLVFLTGEHMSIGMDSAWHSSLAWAMRESIAWDGGNPDGNKVP